VDTGNAVTVIGLCGRSGSGKTTVCKAFEKYGVMSVDTDKVYRELTAPVAGKASPLVRTVADAFGDGVVGSDGSLDRRALAAAVFGEGNKEKLELLNSITHKPILDRTDEMIVQFAAEGAVGVIVDAPALFESGFHEKCDVILCITAPDDVLVRRIVARDGITEEAAMKRLSSQITEAELRRRADLIIVNDGTTDLSAEAEKTVRKIFGIN